jgi:large subunit ribosomal protein L3
MLKSILGTKIGMTRIFDSQGNIVPVTVVLCGPCVVASIRTKEKDGYNALGLGFGDVKEKSMTKPEAGLFKKNNIPLKKHIREFSVDNTSEYKLGQEIQTDVFKPGDYIDVSGISKGRGFAGGVKRHGFAGGPSSHGQSDRQRAPGSVGCQGFQRVIRGLRMAGRLGGEKVTIQGLEVVSVDPSKSLMLIKGAVPGTDKGLIVIEETVKRIKFKVAPQLNKKELQKKKDAAKKAESKVKK